MVESEGGVPGGESGAAAESLSADRQLVSFESVYESERAALVGLALVLSGDTSVAEDLAQEAFLRLHERWGRVSQYENPGAWLRHVLVNLATSRRRRMLSEARALLRLNRERPVGVALAWDEAFWAVVRRLPRRQAQALALFYLEDHSVSDVAAILGCAEGTVRALLHQGRQALATRLHLEDASDD